MRRVPCPLILRWAILTGYALLVSLGHGGWHVVVDHDSCLAHGSHAGCGNPEPVTVKTTCSHGHVHTHLAKRCAGSHQHDAPGEHAPPHVPHDSDHCSVSAIFSAPQTVVSVVEVVFFVLEANPITVCHTVLVPASQVLLPTPRGPPVC